MIKYMEQSNKQITINSTTGHKKKNRNLNITIVNLKKN